MTIIDFAFALNSMARLVAAIATLITAISPSPVGDGADSGVSPAVAYRR